MQPDPLIIPPGIEALMRTRSNQRGIDPDTDPVTGDPQITGSPRAMADLSHAALITEWDD